LGAQTQAPTESTPVLYIIHKSGCLYRMFFGITKITLLLHSKSQFPYGFSVRLLLLNVRLIFVLVVALALGVLEMSPAYTSTTSDDVDLANRRVKTH